MLTLEERLEEKQEKIRAQGLQPIALGYGRKSFVKRGAVFISTTYHEEVCAEYCESRGWKLEWFADDKPGQQSGKSEKNRPEWQRLKAQVTRPEVIAVICENTRAVFRNTKLILNYIDEWSDGVYPHEKGSDVEFIDLSMPTLDVRTPDGRAMLTVKAAFDESESRRASDRLKKHIKAVRTRGGFWGKVPLGLRADGKGDKRHLLKSDEGIWWLNHHQVIGVAAHPPFDETHSNAAQYEFRGYLQTVIKWLELFTTFDIGSNDGARVLTERGYCWRDMKGMPRAILAADLWRTGKLLPYYRGVIDERLLDRAQLRLEQRADRKMNGPKQKYPVPLLWRILYCPVCGSRYVTTSNVTNGGDRHYVYRHSEAQRDCPNNRGVTVTRIENQLWGLLGPVMQLTTEQKKSIAEIALAKREPTPILVDPRQVIQKKLARLKELYVDGFIKKEEYTRDYNALMREMTTLPPSPRPANRLHKPYNVNDAVQQLDDIFAILRDGTDEHPEQVNAALRSMFKAVYIKDREIIRLAPYEWCAPWFETIAKFVEITPAMLDTF